MRRIKVKLKVYDGTYYTRKGRTLEVSNSKFSYRDINCFLNKKNIYEFTFYDQRVRISFKEETEIRLNAQCIKKYISLCKCYL